MKLKEFIEILQDESIDQESEVNYAILYNPDKKYIKFEVEEEVKNGTYKQRMINEYNELKERTDKLGFMLVKESQGDLEFELSCPVSLLKVQYSAMNSYLNILKVRAEIS